MSTPKEFEWPDLMKWVTESTCSTNTGNYNMYYERMMPHVEEYLEKVKIRDEGKRRMVEDSFFEFKYNPVREVLLRGDIHIGTCTNADKEEPDPEPPKEELQYFDPKDLDI